MYPDEELTRLAARKIALRRNIAVCRADCAQAAVAVARPLVWLDAVMAVARRLSPFARTAAVPLGFILRRTLFSRWKLLGALVSWGPLVAGVARRISSLMISCPPVRKAPDKIGRARPSRHVADPRGKRAASRP